MDHTVGGVRGPGVDVRPTRVDHANVATSGMETESEGSAELRKLAEQLQGVFIQQLFKAMRDTVPQSGSAFGQAGSEMFSGVMDEHLADAASAQLQKGLGQAIYRQLSGVDRVPDLPGMKSDPGTVDGAGEDLT